MNWILRIFQQLWLKVFSVGLAVLLWIIVAGEETVERGLRVSLELQQFPAGLEMAGGEPPSTVDVRVRGASGALARLSPTDVIAMLDLRSARPGRRLFHLAPEQVRVPFGVEVLQVMPATIALVFENSATRQVPVVPDVEGRPAAGYVVGKIIAEPSTVEVIGPETAVKNATEAMTDPVAVTDASSAVRETVTVGHPDPTLRIKNARTVAVTVQVLPAPGERTIRGRALHLRNLPPSLEAQATPAIVEVGVRGDREALSKVNADDVVAYVDLAGLGAGEYTLTVHADAPPEVGVMAIEPSSVQVRIASGKN